MFITKENIIHARAFRFIPPTINFITLSSNGTLYEIMDAHTAV